MSKVIIAGWISSVLGSILWIYGYFFTGNPSIIDWHAHMPWWIADYLPNIESEIGLLLVCVGTALNYWPSRK